jgi:hypothetical protein
MVKAVHRVPLRSRALVQDRQQHAVEGGRQALYLYPYVALPDQLQNFGQQRQRFTISNPDLTGFRQSHLGDGPKPGNIRIVVDDDPTIPSGVDIQLHSVGVQHHCPPKGRS